LGTSTPREIEVILLREMVRRGFGKSAEGAREKNRREKK